MNKKSFKIIPFEKNKKIELNENEIDLKNKLLSIEKKFDSIDKVLNNIIEDNPSTIYGEEIFGAILTSIAMDSASGIIEDYFDNKKKENNQEEGK
jgi:hypothetical protein